MDTNKPWSAVRDKIRSEVRCWEERTKPVCACEDRRPVRFTDKAGREHYRLQCQRCGNGTSMLKTGAARPAREWDESIRSRWQERVNQYWERARAANMTASDKEREAFIDYYNAYLSSPRWAATRRRLLRGNCMACGLAPASHLHHNTYQRLGEEADEDLDPLCGDCHRALHRHMWRGQHYQRGAA